MEGDGEFNYAYYCMHKFHWLPSVYANLSMEEKAFVIAAIDIKLENDKKQQKEIERKSRKK